MVGARSGECELLADMGEVRGLLQVDDWDAVLFGDAQSLAGAAAGFAVGRPADDEPRRGVETWAEDLEDVARMERLDEGLEAVPYWMVPRGNGLGGTP